MPLQTGQAEGGFTGQGQAPAGSEGSRYVRIHLLCVRNLPPGMGQGRGRAADRTHALHDQEVPQEQRSKERGMSACMQPPLHACMHAHAGADCARKGHEKMEELKNLIRALRGLARVRMDAHGCVGAACSKIWQC